MQEDDGRERGKPRLQALRDILVGTPGADETSSRASASPAYHDDGPPPERIGRYAIVRKLGQGGMGVVYEARDERLERMLAIKTLRGLVTDDTARRRFWREAKAAAAVNHPNICQLYEIGEEDGELFIAMELLAGQSLSERLKPGALRVDEAVPIALGVLGALSALHGQNLIHRDLKPSNVFLTPHGVKLLDFGLARPADPPDVSLSQVSMTDLTQPGALVGTPRYMSPEQVAGAEVSYASDVFSAGAILFEMLAGQPAFGGRTVVEVLYATLHEQPPALSGSPAVAAADRVVRRAVAKNPKDRYPSADAMAKDLRAALLAEGTDSSAHAQALTRLVVLPFRSLRPDPDTDFLSFGLADAITTSLSGLPALVVRSSAAAARLAGETLDLKMLAAEADVDRVLTGTLLRSGGQLRVSTQLVEAPAGTLVWSHTTQASLGDVFALQDDLTRGIVEALALPLAGPGAAPKPDVPRSARAYEFYLRANEVSRRYDQLTVARDLYLRCLDEDPGFAPAWAQLGRCHRVIGKYYEDSAGNRARAEAAFARAFELNPDLPTAHKLFTHLEAETGHAPRAVQRLLALAKTRRNDAELFAGLVHALRYCGLLEASMAAHEEARRLDPHVPTSLEYTLLANGDFERLAQEGRTLVDQDAQLLGYSIRGLHAEAREVFERLQVDTQPAIMRLSMRAFASLVDPESSDRTRAAIEEAVASHLDPEALFLFGWIFAARGDGERALEVLERGVRGGYFAARTLERDERLDGLRGEPRFRELVKAANAGRSRALAAFREAGGFALLGLEPA